MQIINVTLGLSSGTHTLSNGNLTDTMVGQSAIRATHSKNNGKWYWEVKFDSGSPISLVGIASSVLPLSPIPSVTDSRLRGIDTSSPRKFPENQSYGSSLAVGDVVGVFLDLDNSTLAFSKNGVSLGISHTNLATLGEVYPFIRGFNGGTATQTFTINFGSTPFKYSPAGYLPYVQNPDHKILLLSGSKSLSFKDNSVIQISAPTEKSYLDFGMESDSKVRLADKQTIKKYIQNNSGTFESGKTYEHNIDTSKYKIDKLRLE